MPASAALASVIALPANRPEPFRLVRSGRGCPSCGDTFCDDPSDCLFLLTSRPWGDCDRCDGTGWGGEDSLSIFCETCVGSGAEERDPGTTPALNARAAARLADRIAYLRDRLGVVA
ncbi:hypothetical protein ABZ901_22935 [Actinacidiphila alni]|uniref:hypothetical protein n=1 Tax=Actinacidiphila alni TaxID=380248 RepID=UPI0033E97B10